LRQPLTGRFSSCRDLTACWEYQELSCRSLFPIYPWWQCWAFVWCSLSPPKFWRRWPLPCQGSHRVSGWKFPGLAGTCHRGRAYRRPGRSFADSKTALTGCWPRFSGSSRCLDRYLLALAPCKSPRQPSLGLEAKQTWQRIWCRPFWSGISLETQGPSDRARWCRHSYKVLRD